MLFDEDARANRIFARLRTRFYIIDEPERHLHPRLQRTAARWLADTHARAAFPVSGVSSHSASFLSLTGDTRFLYIRRISDSDSAVEIFEPEHLTALCASRGSGGLNGPPLLRPPLLPKVAKLPRAQPPHLVALMSNGREYE